MTVVSLSTSDLLLPAFEKLSREGLAAQKKAFPQIGGKAFG
jgi:hypothetical protein